jgi:hypothetical protein
MPTKVAADRIRRAGFANPGASETGETICTEGNEDAHDTPEMVLLVGLPAPSLKVTVRLNGAPPGQVTPMQVGVLTASTGVQEVEAPSETQKLFFPGPS